MASARTQRNIVAAVGLVGSAIFVALAFRRLDVQTVVEAWHHAHPLPWIPLAVVAYIGGHFVRGQRLRILVQRESVLSLATATNIVVVGYASNNVFPARLGELVRIGMLSERTGIPVAQAFTVTFIERLLDGIAILLLALAGVASLPTRPEAVWNVARIGSVVFGGALAVVLVSVFFPSAVLSMASRLSRRVRPAWRDRVLALASSITSAGAILRKPRGALAVAVSSLVVWLFEAAMFAFLLPVFSLKLELGPALVAMTVTNLGILVPSSPGFVGTFHYFCQLALVSLGVPAATAMGYAVVVHLTFFVPVTLWGAGAILWYGVQVGSTAALARTARRTPKVHDVSGVPVHTITRLEDEPAGQAPSAFDLALAGALVGSEREGGDPGAVRHAATFVAEELRALPPRLRVLYEAGMATFRFWVHLRYFHNFCGLDPVRQRAAVDAWSFGRVRLLRQLFRPARSLTLLAYYEHEDVARKLSPGLDARG